MDMTVFGLPLSIMNQLSTFGTQINLLPKNSITVSAGDDSGLQQAWSGSIIACVIDFNQPEVAMRITANAAAAFSAGSVTPLSFTGKVDVPTVMGQIAQQMGLQLENNGVNSQLSNSYLYGSPRDMYNKIRRHADIYATIDRGTLAIWPKFQNRTSAGAAITISPTDQTLIGYPAFTANGMMFTALYNSGFGIGKQVTIEDSQITQANATWNIYNVNHNLESQEPNGKWESILFATSPKFPTPIAST